MKFVLAKVWNTVSMILRWLFNRSTGNALGFMRTDLLKDIRKAEMAAVEARDIVRRLHDTQQETLLLLYKQKERAE